MGQRREGEGPSGAEEKGDGGGDLGGKGLIRRQRGGKIWDAIFTL